MDGSDSPSLEVGFIIDTGGSFSELAQLERVMGSAEAKIVAEAANIERATGSMVQVGGATASISAFGNAATRELQKVNREKATTEKIGEALVRQLEREAGAFGKTRDQMRDAKVEAIALTAAQQGNIDLADRLAAASRARAQAAEAAADAEAQAAARAQAAMQAEATAIREAQQAYQMFQGVAAQRMATYRHQQAAEAESARSAQTLIDKAERLRASIDPVTAAQQRYNREMAEARALRVAGAITFDEYVGKLRMEQAALDASGGALGRHTKNAMGNRMAMHGASYQVQDFITQVSMGANPVNAFAVQGAQLAGQFSNIEGKAGNLARFFMGPWGLAITAGMMLSPFVAKLFEMNDALGDAVDKLKKDAKETEATARAKELFRRTQEGVTAAIRAGTEATKQSIEADRTSGEQANLKAQRDLRDITIIREKTAALLAQERAALGAANATNFGAAGGAGAGMAQVVYSGRVADLLKLEKENADAAREAQTRLQVTRVDLAKEAATRMADPMQKIKTMYADQAAAATRNAHAQIKVGKELTHAQGVQLARQLAQIERNRDAKLQLEQEAQQAARRTSTAMDQSGRNITLSQGRSIAEGVGAHITNAQRDRQTQERLYAKYVAYKSGNGPWAALAAKPGTSFHELGQAIDVAKTQGMTLRKLVDAFRAAGVKVVEKLDEGSHFHIAWAKVGAAAKEQTAAASEAAHEVKEAARVAAQQVTEAQNYAVGLYGETEKIGQTAEQIKMIEIAAAAAKAPTKELRDAIFAAGDAWQVATRMEEFGQINLADMVKVPSFEEFMPKTDPIAEQMKSVLDNLADIADQASVTGDALANAFGAPGEAIGSLLANLADYQVERQRLGDEVMKGNMKQATADKALGALQARNTGQAIAGIKGLFKEHSTAYKVMGAVEKAHALLQLVNTVRSIALDSTKTASSIANSGARAMADGVAAVAKAIASLPFPANIAAGAATIAALAAIGVSVAGGLGGGGSKPAPTNTGTGTVFGDPSAKSDSIKNAIDALRQVDTLTNTYARQMASSLRSIESQIGGIASLVVRAGDVNASAGVTEGFKMSTIGSVLSKIPLIGGILGGLFGSTTTVTGSGLSAGPQSVGNIMNGGFEAQYYSDIRRRSRFLGITTGTSNSTRYTDADGGLETQFALLLRQFNDAIVAAAGPLGSATSEIQDRLNGFVINLGRIDLKDLSGAEIQEKLSAVFGAAADNMANAAFPGLQQFQKVGEGAFETLVRVASTVEAVSGTLDLLGQSASRMSIAAKLGLADQFESVSALNDAAAAYFQTFYSKEEQAAAKTAQLANVFASLNLTMPATLASFRQMVEAQDLTSAAGQETYATLLKLAPAFAELQTSMEGVKSAADIASERLDLQRQLLQLQGDTAALRALDLAKVDVSNRALQQQIWAMQDGQEAAKAADELRKAWTSVGDSIMDEVKRIRGLTGVAGGGSFASLQAQFNAANVAARGGDMDAAKSLPQLSQALLTAAAAAARSRQELDRIQAQTAASLEATYGIIGALGAAASTAVNSSAAMVSSAGTNQAATTPSNDNARMDSLAEAFDRVHEELVGMRSEQVRGFSTVGGNTGRLVRKWDDVTSESGGLALSMVATGSGSKKPVVTPTPIPSKDNTYANSDGARANGTAFASTLLDIEQQITALGG